MNTILFNQKMSFLLRSILFFFFFFSFLNTFVSPTQPDLCHPDQRDALLDFKTEFGIHKPAWLDSEISSYPKTKSWVNKSDCCSWDGITCDAKSGKVIGLDLTASCLYGWLESNSSLFRLHHLRDLNLSYNNFSGSPIPAKFEKLKELERLNLSKSSFSGQIPTKLLQLTKLVSLDLSSFPPEWIDLSSSSLFMYPQNSLSSDESFLRLLAQNLRNLRDLDMSYLNISSKIPLEFSTMWSLRSLNFKGCSLFGEFPSSVLLMPNLESIRLDNNRFLSGTLPVFRGNNSMKILSLSVTSFSGTIPDSISNLKHLTFLELDFSPFSGRIPSSLGNLSHLSYLSLSYNKLDGEIPFSLGNLSHLSTLDLSGNKLIGEIPSSVGNLKQLSDFDVSDNKLRGNIPSALFNLTQLRFISLCFNQFSGFLPPNLSQLSKLEVFFLCRNSFTGAIPSSLFTIPSLTDIHLDGNQFSDLLGIENISLLPNLQYLFLDNNKFKISPVDLNVFSPLKRLGTLSLSGIPLSTSNITSDSDFQSHLTGLALSGCNITEFPEFIRNQRSLQTLDLSNNKIKGQVPDWLWRLPELSRVDLSNNGFNGFLGSASPGSRIDTVDLSSNAFQAPIFIPSRFVRYYLAYNNNFTGEIPRSLCELSYLSVLDLSNNNFHGSIPRCLAARMSTISYLNLHQNRLKGSLPNIFMKAKNLKSLDVSHNQLVGKLPTSLIGCSTLEVLNVGNNRINDTFPFWLNSLPQLQVLVLRSNEFHGVLHHPQVAIGFPHLRIIDVSHNEFMGTLRSDYFKNWKAMYTNIGDDTELYMINDGGYYYSLDLPSKGVEMEMTRILTIFTAVDFSGNKIQGSIPESIGLLKGLRVLNLSCNGFTGNIPSSLENLTKLESLDLSQNKLSGEIPPQLGGLSSLAWINVSHNQLVGSIPQGTQFQRQNCSSYEGNPGLYGPSLKDVCGDKYAPTPPQPEPLEPEEEEEEEWLSLVAAGLGFVPGVVFGLTIRYIMASYKHEWFMKTFGRNKHGRSRTR